MAQLTIPGASYDQLFSVIKGLECSLIFGASMSRKERCHCADAIHDLKLQLGVVAEDERMTYSTD